MQCLGVSSIRLFHIGMYPFALYYATALSSVLSLYMKGFYLYVIIFFVNFVMIPQMILRSSLADFFIRE